MQLSTLEAGNAAFKLCLSCKRLLFSLSPPLMYTQTHTQAHAYTVFGSVTDVWMLTSAQKPCKTVAAIQQDCIITYTHTHTNSFCLYTPACYQRKSPRAPKTTNMAEIGQILKESKQQQWKDVSPSHRKERRRRDKGWRKECGWKTHIIVFALKTSTSLRPLATMPSFGLQH